MLIIITYFFKYFNSAIEGVEETKQQKGKKGAQSATGDKQGNDGDMEPDEPTNKDDSKLTTAKDEPASPENDKQVFVISDSFSYSNFAFPTLLFNFK